MKIKQSTETLFYKITQYIYYFFSLNALFLLCNTLFFLTVWSIPLSISNIIIFAASLIPAGASITSLFYTMGKLNRDKTISPFKDFFNSYKVNFRQSTQYWGLFLVVSVILIVDILFVLQRGWLVLTVISIILYTVFILSAIYAFSLLSRFEVSLKHLVIFSVYLTFRYKRITFSHLCYAFAFSMIMFGFFRFAVLFIFSVTAFYFMRSNEGILEELKHEFSREREEFNV